VKSGNQAAARWHGNRLFVAIDGVSMATWQQTTAHGAARLKAASKRNRSGVVKQLFIMSAYHLVQAS